MTPVERTRELLDAERDAGHEFDVAWQLATSTALAEATSRETWAEVLRWSRDAFERAYCGRPRRAMDWLQPLEFVADPIPPAERVVVLG